MITRGQIILMRGHITSGFEGELGPQMGRGKLLEFSSLDWSNSNYSWRCFTKHKCTARRPPCRSHFVPHCLCTALPSPPAVTEWSCLLLHDIICSEGITMHFQWRGNLSLVTLTFDLDIQTRMSEGPITSSMWIWRKSIQQFPRYFIHKKSQTAPKTESYAVHCARIELKCRHCIDV